MKPTAKLFLLLYNFAQMSVRSRVSKQVVAARVCAYDKFLRQGDERKDLAKLLQNEARAPQCLPGAECVLATRIQPAELEHLLKY